MSLARYIVGDVFDVMATLPDNSVDLVLTSPPFLALRSYLPADHPQKAKEIGSEPTPAAYLDTLLALTAEWRRVLAPHGSICVELGDTYSGNGTGDPGGANSYGAHLQDDRTRGGKVPRRDMQHGWPPAKSLCGIPTLYAWSLAYGRNLLTGQPSPAGQWRVRNLIVWCRPNPPVGALGDKVRPASSYLINACVGTKRYFDLDSVRTPHTEPGVVKRTTKGASRSDGWMRPSESIEQNPAGAPPLDYWEIPTHPYPGAHYATWPPALCVKPILSMCPQKVCRVCGRPSERIVESDRRGYDPNRPEPYSIAQQEHGNRVGYGTRTTGCETVVTTLGWTDCGHDNWRPGHILDPFAGSGTTLAVATGHGRTATGIDLDPRNADLARERCGMFLELDDHPPPRPIKDTPENVA